MPSISKRAEGVPMSPFRKLSPFADIAKAAGKHVYHLNIGQPDIETPPMALTHLKAIDIPVLEYSPAAGLPSYRKKLLRYYEKYGTHLSPEEILVTTGASEAIQWIFLACLNPGEEIIVPEPFYATYNGFAHIAEVVIKPITCSIENGFALPDIREFERLMTPKTRAVFITNPSNPTGRHYSKEALEALSHLVKAYDLFLFSDEVYREFCYGDAEFLSALNLPGLENNVVMIDSISKRYSACGARVGSIVCRNRNLLESLTRYAKLRLSPPVLGQLLAEALLDVEDAYVEAVREEYDRRREILFNRLQGMPGVVSYNPGGAFYCFAKFPVESAEHFCQWLLESFEHNGATVMLSPGSGFYATPGLGEDQVRIAYILNRNDLDAAMDCLEKALAVYPGRKDAAVIEEKQTQKASYRS
jgi:aspartate aminotransferase